LLRLGFVGKLFTLVAVGEQVEALFNGQSKWYPAVIFYAHKENTYNVAYSDGYGHTRTNVPSREIRVRNERVESDLETSTQKLQNISLD